MKTLQVETLQECTENGSDTASRKTLLVFNSIQYHSHNSLGYYGQNPPLLISFGNANLATMVAPAKTTKPTCVGWREHLEMMEGYSYSQNREATAGKGRDSFGEKNESERRHFAMTFAYQG